MNHRSVPRIGRLLCGLASALMLGLLAAPASAQSSGSSTATFTVGPYVSVKFDDPIPRHDLRIVPDESWYVGGVAETAVSQTFTVKANTAWTLTGTLTRPIRASPAPTTAPGDWFIKLDGGVEVPDSGAATLLSSNPSLGPGPVWESLSARLRVVLELADGGGGPKYLGGILLLEIAPT